MSNNLWAIYWDASVDGHASRWFSGDIDLLLGDREVVSDGCCLCMYMGKQSIEDQTCNCRGSYAQYHISPPLFRVNANICGLSAECFCWVLIS